MEFLHSATFRRVVEKAGPDFSEACRKMMNSSGHNVQQGEIQEDNKEIILDRQSGQTLEQEPRKAVESPFLEMYKIWRLKALNSSIKLQSGPALSR